MKKRQFLIPDMPQAYPAELAAIINEFQRYKTRREVLDAAYDLLTTKYRGYRLKTVYRLHELIDNDITNMWERSGFIHCNKMNYLLGVLLLGSNKFTGDDIEFKWTAIFYFSPHQYVKVRVGENEWVNVDVWGNAYGIPLGSYGHGLRSGTITSSERD